MGVRRPDRRTRTRRISGGGRYDGLIEEIGGPPTPGIGFGAGIERLLLALEDGRRRPPTPPRARRLLRRSSRAGRARCALGWLKELRDAGVAADADYAGRSLKGQLTQARRARARDTIVIVGADGATLRRRGAAGRTARLTTTFVGRLLADELAHAHVRRARPRARRRAAHARRLGRAPPRPRRPRLRRPARPHRRHAARDQPRALARGRRGRARASATSSSSAPRASWSRARRRRSTRTMPTGEVELAGRRPRDRLALDAAAVPARRGERRRDAAPALPLARPAPRQAAAQHPLRAQMVGIIRREMEEAGFLDIQTPILFKPTPEGARDFVVPSRLQRGRFYALPQSPQILKQLTMVAGFDRYYQIAICFRDEDLRADRVQEITQLDVEMSFPDQEFLFALMERMFARIWRECARDRDRDAVPADDLRRGRPALRLRQARHRASGSRSRTRPRRRAARSSASSPNAEAVRFLRVPQDALPQRARDARGVREGVGGEGARVPRLRRGGRGRARRSRSSSPRRSSPRFAASRGRRCSSPPTSWPLTSRVLGALRLHLGRELGLIDEEAFTFLWVTDFPMFEWDEDAGRWTRGPPPVHAADRRTGRTASPTSRARRSRTPTT